MAKTYFVLGSSLLDGPDVLYVPEAGGSLGGDDMGPVEAAGELPGLAYGDELAPVDMTELGAIVLGDESAAVDVEASE